jgi:hypothetical protein
MNMNDLMGKFTDFKIKQEKPIQISNREILFFGPNGEVMEFAEIRTSADGNFTVIQLKELSD